MDATAIRTLLADGSLATVLNWLAPDDRADMALVNPDASQPNEPLTVARVGRAILIQPGSGRLVVHVHGHGPEDDDQCWESLRDMTQEAVAQFNLTALAMREHVGVQQMIRAGMHPALAARFNGIEPPMDLEI